MRKVILYIAMSLDGYIADQNGNVDWLNEYDSDEDVEGTDSYSLFLDKVDTVIIGYNTYHQIVTELSPEQWVYCLHMAQEDIFGFSGIEYVFYQSYHYHTTQFPK